MGAGYHGGFGKTKGKASHEAKQERYRIGYPVSPTKKSLEMALNPSIYVKAICEKYNIHLKSGKTIIKIEINPMLAPAGRVVKSRPNIIELGSKAFVSETELANTIAHELNHARSYLKGGKAPEKTAYLSGNTLEKYIRGKK